LPNPFTGSLTYRIRAIVLIRILRPRAKTLVAVFAVAPLGHVDLLNKLIALSRSAVRWENKKEGKAGFQKKKMEPVAHFSLAEVAQF
jgi:hypothetical protein